VADLGLVLWLAGSQALCERAPERIEPRVGHLEHPAEVARLRPIEEQLGGGCVRIAAVLALEHPEGHEGVEEIERAALVEAEATAKLLPVEGPSSQLREDPKLDRAQERLRPP